MHPDEDSDNQDSAMPEASFGYGPFRIHSRIPTWRTLKRWLRGPDLAEQVRVLVQSAKIESRAPDRGLATFYFWVINLSRKRATIDRFILHQWTWMNHVLSDHVVPAFTGAGTRLDPQSLQFCALKIGLDRQAVARLEEVCPKQTAALLGGACTLSLSGELHVTPSEHPVRVELQCNQPSFSLYWLKG